jgi:Methyltransferase domain
MKCLVCDSDSNYYFSKSYTDSPFRELMSDIGEIDYYKCVRCGFVLSQTHRELDKFRWESLNNNFHHHIENLDNKKIINQPPYAEQAMMLVLLGKNKIINTASMIDYAGGYGSLSNIMEKYHSIFLPIYDPFVQCSTSDRYVKRENLIGYKTVINSAMFEHILNRNDLEEVNSIVEENGALILHTVICENIPKDPNWFYLIPPVHTAFHTNKSMEILMSQWGYHSSIYCPPSKCWVLLKEKSTSAEKLCNAINKELRNKWFYFKHGFVDYWKGF